MFQSNICIIKIFFNLLGDSPGETEAKCGQEEPQRPNAASPRFQGWDQMRPVHSFGGETKHGQSAVPGARPYAASPRFRGDPPGLLDTLIQELDTLLDDNKRK